MSESRTKPGVMIYFNDVRPFFRAFSKEQLGALFEAVVDYAENGEWPSADCDSGVILALDVLRDKIDRDGEAYERKKLHGQYMTYVRETKEDGRTPMPESQWVAMITAQIKAHNLQ